MGVVITAAAWFAFIPREPAYQGKGLSEWLKLHGNSTGGAQVHAEQAIHQIGTNALPTLLDMLITKDSWPKGKLIQLASNQSLVYFNFSSEHDRRFLAVYAIQVLGPAARPALPRLIELLNQADTTDVAKDALGPVADKGFEPQEAMLLARSFSNQHPTVCANVLDLLSSDRGVVVNALLPCLSNNDPEDRITAIHALVRLGAIHTIPQRDGENSAIVHTLMKSLQDSFPGVRAAAARALGGFGTEAQDAVPSLIKHVSDSDGGVRKAVAAALARIGPDPRAHVDAEAAVKADWR